MTIISCAREFGLAISFLLVACSAVGAEPVYPVHWARQFGTSSGDNGFSLAVGTDGSVVVAGVTNGNLGGQTSNGASDAFVVKYDADGNELWTRLLGTSADEQAQGVDTKEFEGVLVTGSTQGNLGGKINSGMHDVFLSKWNVGGVYHWTVLLGSPAVDVGEDVIKHPGQGRYFVAGWTHGNLHGEINSGSGDAFLCGISVESPGTLGPLTWCRLVGTAGDDAAYGVTHGLGTEVLVVGRVMGSIFSEPHSGSADAFLVGYANTGSYLSMISQFGTPSWDEAREVAVDAATGEIYIVGVTDGNLRGELNNGGRDAFLAKHDADGNHLWTRLIGSSADDEAFGVAVNSGSGVFVTGHTTGNLDGQSPAGAKDIFLTKFDLQGQHFWTKLLGTTGQETGSDVAIDPSGAVLLAGYSQGSLAGPSAGAIDGVVTRFVDSGVVPAVSTWGLMIFVLLSLISGSLVLARRTRGAVHQSN